VSFTNLYLIAAIGAWDEDSKVSGMIKTFWSQNNG